MAKNKNVEKQDTKEFPSLVKAIEAVHGGSIRHVKQAVNTTLTLRNWLIGANIREYEQKGEDRAVYGDQLLEKLSLALRTSLDTSYTGRYLGLCRQLYGVYPQIRKSVISEFNISNGISVPKQIQKSTISEFSIGAETLLQNLSFTHLTELMSIDTPLKRAFYEVECIRGNWSVRELKRQVATLYFERSGYGIRLRSRFSFALKGIPSGVGKRFLPGGPVKKYCYWEYTGVFGSRFLSPGIKVPYSHRTQSRCFYP